MGNALYNKLKEKSYTPRKIAEVGVYLPQTSNILDFVLDKIPTILVEPEPRSIKAISDFFSEDLDITLIPYAAYDKSCELELTNANASTFVSELSASPAIINDGLTKSDNTFKVKAVTFDEIDPGDIDLLSIDIEGSEWFVLKYMTSRPDVISIETHGAIYINPYLNEINNWLNKNSYIIWYKDGSDSIFIRQGLFDISLTEKFTLFFYEQYLKIKRQRKILKRKLKNLFLSKK